MGCPNKATTGGTKNVFLMVVAEHDCPLHGSSPINSPRVALNVLAPGPDRPKSPRATRSTERWFLNGVLLPF